MDISDLKEILRILETQDITEFELEQDGVKLRVCRSTGHPAVTTSPGPLPGLATATHAVYTLPASPPGGPPNPGVEAAAPAATVAPPEGTVVKSPIVGTFYRSPDPNAAPFVNVGDQVRIGQILCIIEAMKLMNEIEAEVAGEIVKVHPENGQPVQYGDPLFTVRPS